MALVLTPVAKNRPHIAQIATAAKWDLLYKLGNAKKDGRSCYL